MNSIQFETEYKDGLIKIPDEYHIEANSHLKVIVLFDEQRIKNNIEYFTEICNKYNNTGEIDLNINDIYKNREEKDSRDVGTCRSMISAISDKILNPDL